MRRDTQLCGMKKPKQKPMGRPLLGDKPMKQIAIRFPDDMLSEVDAIAAERFGHADRTAIIRELVAQALADRKQRGKR